METDHYYLNKSMQKKTTQNLKTGPAASLFFDFKATEQNLVRNRKQVEGLWAGFSSGGNKRWNDVARLRAHTPLLPSEQFVLETGVSS